MADRLASDPGKRRLIQGGIDLKEHLAGLDIGAFRKQALLDDATHLRTHFSY